MIENACPTCAHDFDLAAVEFTPREELRHEPLLSSLSLLSGRIGIFGGSFDPPHLGHLALAKAAKKELGLDTVVFIPTRQNPLKSTTPSATPEQRLTMLSEMLRSEPGFYVSPLELMREGSSYTIDTLNQIHNEVQAPSAIFLLMGEDGVKTLPKWKDVQKIPELATIVVIPRSGYQEFPSTNIELTRLGVEKVPLLEISSSRIRQELSSGHIPRDLAPEVLEYIVQNDLYK